MQQRHVGASGLRVSRLGLGTMTWGRDTDEHEAREQLRDFTAAGGTLVDTAAGYGDGASEELLGSLIGDVVARDDLVLATKAGLGRRRGVREVDLSRGGLLRALDGSLRRLGVDSVDLWQLHTWSDDVPLAETLSALETAVSTGRAAYVGVSNYNGWQTARAATLCELRDASPTLVAAQMEYSLLSRGVEHEVLPAAGSLGMGALAWSPLGRGVLTGKYRTGTPADSRGGSDHFAGFVAPYLGAGARGVVEAVSKAADGLEWTPLEVALCWVRDRPGITAPLVGARTAAQLRGALATEELTLPPALASALDDVSVNFAGGVASPGGAGPATLSRA